MAPNWTLFLAVFVIGVLAILFARILDRWRAQMKYYKNVVGRYSAHHAKHPLGW
jgi:hypothetical protein